MSLKTEKVKIKTDFTKEYGTKNLDIGYHVTLDIRYTIELIYYMNQSKF